MLVLPAHTADSLQVGSYAPHEYVFLVSNQFNPDLTMLFVAPFVILLLNQRLRDLRVPNYGGCDFGVCASDNDLLKDYKQKEQRCKLVVDDRIDLLSALPVVLSSILETV